MKLYWSILVLFAAFLAGCSGSSEPASRSGQERAFEAELGFIPGPEIAEIKSRMVQVGDAWAHWLTFTYTSNTFAQIISNGFSCATVEEEKDGAYSLWEQGIESPGPNAPTWWKKPERIAGVVYHKDKSRNGFAASYTFVWIDTSNQVVYLHTSAWD